MKRKMQRGSLAMANSGKNTNSSQFFVVLTNVETKLSKMNGKYVVFGEVEVRGAKQTRVVGERKLEESARERSN